MVAERSQLQQLIDRAEAASARMSVTNPARRLLGEMAVALVAQARLVADLSAQASNSEHIGYHSTADSSVNPIKNPHGRIILP